MYLVIAEKPSVSRAIAEVIGAQEREDGYLQGTDCMVSWCFGHLAEYVSPDAYDEKFNQWRYEDLPIIPKDWKVTVSEDKKDQFYILKRLLNSPEIEYVVNACDAGREGELIFKHVYDLSGSKKPVKRLWISSLEDSAILDGMQHLRSAEEYRHLAEAAVCRSQADWLVGMNATRAYTTKYFKKLTVGRVQTPTLAMLVERAGQISNFQKEKYFNVELDCDGIPAVKSKIFDPDEAEQLRSRCQGSEAIVTAVKETEKKVKAPKLYDLTTLQREANRIYGMTAKQTLDTAQSLYEKKLASYPRTDSRYLTSHMENSTRMLVEQTVKVLPLMKKEMFSRNVAQVIDNSKVTDHHALIPTAGIAEYDLLSLPVGERSLLTLLMVRLLCAVGTPCRIHETAVTLECGGAVFTVKGRTTLTPGWKQYLAQEKRDAALPEMSEGQVWDCAEAAVKEGKTTPPKHYTEDTLLSAMETAGKEDMPEEAERKGLGTPATRAAIIEKLVATGFVERKRAKKAVSLVPAHTGVSLITVLPEQLQSPLLTAEWEYRLQQVESGELSPDEFMTGIADMLTELVKTYKVISGAEVLFPSGREVIGKCPRCGSDVTESKKGFFCEKNDCRFGLWRDNKFFAAKRAALTKKVAAALLADGRVKLTGLYSEKTGGTYDATAVLEDTGESVRFRLEFDKGART